MRTGTFSSTIKVGSLDMLYACTSPSINAEGNYSHQEESHTGSVNTSGTPQPYQALEL